MKSNETKTIKMQCLVARCPCVSGQRAVDPPRLKVPGGEARSAAALDLLHVTCTCLLRLEHAAPRSNPSLVSHTFRPHYL